MGLFSIFKKKPTTAITRPQRPSFPQVVDQVYNQTQKKITEGLSKPTASTGTRIEDLHGAAKTIAQISNIGGGSKATGGGGITEGMKTLVEHGQASTAKKMIEQSTQKKLGK